MIKEVTVNYNSASYDSADSKSPKRSMMPKKSLMLSKKLNRKSSNNSVKFQNIPEIENKRSNSVPKKRRPGGSPRFVQQQEIIIEDAEAPLSPILKYLSP